MNIYDDVKITEMFINDVGTVFPLRNNFSPSHGFLLRRVNDIKCSACFQLIKLISDKDFTSERDVATLLIVKQFNLNFAGHGLMEFNICRATN